MPLGLLLLLLEPGVDLVHLLAVDLLAGQQGGRPAVGDFDLLEHLADDHLDMLVVDLHALEPVDLLDLAHEIFGESLDAEEQYVVVEVAA